MTKIIQNPPASWADYFTFLCQWEGTAYEDNPNDPGGATKYGIDAADHPGIDIAALTAAQASALQYADYCDTQSCRLPEPLNYAYFDFAMNAGEQASAKALQRTVGAPVDGIFGPVTANYAESMIQLHGMGWVLAGMIRWRETWYRNLAWANQKMTLFLGGWIDRSEAMKTWAAARLPASPSTGSGPSVPPAAAPAGGAQ